MNSAKLLKDLREIHSVQELKEVIAILVKELDETQDKLKKLTDAASKKGIYYN